MLKVAVIFVIILLVSNGHALEGRRLSIEEDEELQRELRAINKPAVETIKTEYGDIYDCVDVRKQHAFDHPLLKDHKIKMRPSATVLNTLRASSTILDVHSTGTKATRIGLEKSCPRGTVPIRRTTKQELISAKLNFQRLFVDPNQVNSKDNEFAGLLTYKTPDSNKYYGNAARIAIYQPAVNGDQSSAAMIRLQYGDVGNGDTIEAGWMVMPSLFGDNRTRFYAGWSQQQGGKLAGCYNTYCSGFVAVSRSIALGAPFSDVSTIKGARFDTKMVLNLDPATGDWWLLAQDDTEQIGYWPKELFHRLSVGADVAAWGGLVQTTSNISPPMGSGIYQSGDSSQTNYMAQITVRRGDKFTAPADAEIQVKQSRCYKAGDNYFADPQTWQYRFMFGGPGGTPDTCK